MRILIDTCIVIDALQNREPFNKNAQDIFLLAANRKFDDLSPQNLLRIFTI